MKEMMQKIMEKMMSGMMKPEDMPHMMLPKPVLYSTHDASPRNLPHYVADS